ncbi:ArgS-related anticodon-binding protein NrtL [Streptomyces sp. NPDC047461]|uniref:ArgS-related anticodon-binding protein NrtL n=1 Tax=Streptomyces sp. NPDC047461 TaxID=3155619 RepID=UPI0034000965
MPRARSRRTATASSGASSVPERLKGPGAPAAEPADDRPAHPTPAPPTPRPPGPVSRPRPHRGPSPKPTRLPTPLLPYACPVTPVELSRTVLRAVRRAVDGGELRVTVPGRAVVTPPGPGGCGDYATNIALQLARPAGQPSEKVAEILRPHLLDTPGVTDVVVTGPGFLNISLRDTTPAGLVEEILRRGLRYGHSDRPTGQIVRLHAPHEVRAVVVMDAIARILVSQGALVRTSSQAPPRPEWTDLLGARVDASGTRGAPAPSDVDVDPETAPTDAAPFRVSVGASGAPEAPAALDVDVRPVATPADAAPFRVSVGASGAPEAPAALDVDVRPVATPADSAPFRASVGASGARQAPTPLDVTVRPVPAPTDAAPFGASLDASDTPDAPAPLHINIRPVPAPADPTPLGRDAARWALLHPAAHDRPRITDEHLVQRESNPLFRVRYAHARTRALSRNAADLGFDPHPHPGDVRAGDPHPGHVQPGDPRSGDPQVTAGVLIAALADHPRILGVAATAQTPDRLARHLVTVADATLAFLPTVLPLGDEKPSVAHRSRLALAEAAGTVLAGGLTLLGIDAPDHI